MGIRYGIRHGILLSLCVWGAGRIVAGEFTSGLAGRVTYTDTPGWRIAVETESPEKVFIVNATDATALAVREKGTLREVKIAPCSAAQID